MINCDVPCFSAEDYKMARSAQQCCYFNVSVLELMVLEITIQVGRV